MDLIFGKRRQSDGSKKKRCGRFLVEPDDDEAVTIGFIDRIAADRARSNLPAKTNKTRVSRMAPSLMAPEEPELAIKKRSSRPVNKRKQWLI